MRKIIRKLLAESESKESLEEVEDIDSFMESFKDSIIEKIDDGIYSVDLDGSAYVWEEGGNVLELDEWAYRNIDYLVDEKYKLPERFNKDFWRRPEPLFHGTPKENVDSIMENGLVSKRKTFGSNKSITKAVFTLTYTDAMEYDTTYGDAIIKIDTLKMEKDGFMPYVSQEPSVVEYTVLEAFFHKYENYGFHASMESSSGQQMETVAVHDSIPPKYLSLYKIID
jgi:hypothetical protein